MKNAAERYKSILDLRDNLLGVKEKENKENIELSNYRKNMYAIAVLPFSNLSSDPNTDFLGFPIADQIIGKLAYLQFISVRPSISIRKYENKLIDPLLIRKELKVDYVLTGNYIKEKNDIILTVELVDARSNQLVWRENIQDKYETTFKLLNKVSEEVITGLRIQFSQNERARLQIDIPQNTDSYEQYLKAVNQPSTIKGNECAIKLLNKSIELDSEYAPAFNELGFRIHRLASYKLKDVKNIKKAEAYYMEALFLNNELLSALGNLSILYIETGRFQRAYMLIMRMIKINRNSPMAHFTLGYLYRYAGLLYEAKKEMEKAVFIDPSDNRFRTIGITYYFLNEYENAFKAFNMDENSDYALSYQGVILYKQGQRKRAIEYFNKATDVEEPNALLVLWSVAMRAVITNDIKTGVEALEKMEQGNPPDSDNWYFIASTYALLGKSENCIRALKKAVEMGFINYPFIFKDSFLDSVRNDLTFQDILNVAKKKHEDFKKQYISDAQ
jgi:TolB-like protein